MKIVASFAAMLLTGVVLSSHDINPIVSIFIYLWIISAWEWVYRPLLLDLKKIIEKKFKKSEKGRL